MLKFFNRQPSTLAGTALRDALLAAAGAKDYGTFATLYNANRPAIRAEFPQWLKCPAEIRGDTPATQRYCEGLLFIARVFQDKEDDTLFNALVRPEDNPIARWREDMATADRLIEEGSPGDAVTLLEATLRDVERGQGTAVDELRPRILGRMGIARFRAGDWQGGAENTRRAMALCESAGDEEGVRAYTSNLEIIEQRLTAVFLDGEGNEREPPRPGEGPVKYGFRGGEPVPPAAKALHEEGRAAGARGDYPEALRALTEAARLARYWPYPIYDRAFTHLLLNDWDAALADYRLTLRLAPRDFFLTLTAIDTLQREAEGEFPRGTFLTFSRVKDFLTDPIQRRPPLERLVQQWPGYAPGWLELALLTESPADRLDAIERGLAAKPDAGTKGMLLVNKAMALAIEDREAAKGILREVANDPSSTAPAEAMARQWLSHLDQVYDSLDGSAR